MAEKNTSALMGRFRPKVAPARRVAGEKTIDDPVLISKLVVIVLAWAFGRSL